MRPLRIAKIILLIAFATLLVYLLNSAIQDYRLQQSNDYRQHGLNYRLIESEIALTPSALPTTVFLEVVNTGQYLQGVQTAVVIGEEVVAIDANIWLAPGGSKLLQAQIPLAHNPASPQITLRLEEQNLLYPDLDREHSLVLTSSALTAPTLGQFNATVHNLPAELRWDFSAGKQVSPQVQVSYSFVSGAEIVATPVLVELTWLSLADGKSELAAASTYQETSAAKTQVLELPSPPAALRGGGKADYKLVARVHFAAGGGKYSLDADLSSAIPLEVVL